MKLSPVLTVLIVWIFSSHVVLCKLRSFGPQRTVADVLSNWIFKEKCLGELGCFNNGAPFFDFQERPLSFPPWDREDINTQFFLYTRLNPHNPVKFSNLDRNASLLLQSSFQPKNPVKFIVAGYISSWAPEWENPLKDALLTRDAVNVFIVSWSGGDGPLYEQAVSNTRVVGAEIAVFIDFLHNTTETKPQDVHIIGHSLGSHIAGYAGKRLKGLGRITGLDPAGPYFENVRPEVRLEYTDAVLVDVIHTNGAKNRFQGFGTTESIGDLDFFPNGGSSQPGCPDLGPAVWSFVKHPTLSGGSLFDIMCNHHRAILLFTASINEDHCDMVGVPCKTWDDFLENKCGPCDETFSRCAVMGYDADNSWTIMAPRRANVYLNTTATEPYCE